MSAQYAIGIDLGTTNSVLAYVPLAGDGQVRLLAIPQLTAAGTVEDRPQLPSFVYLGTDAERQAGSWNLPWAGDRDFAVGTAAVRQSADVPTRTVVAAKSWLGHARVDRHEAILPWQAPADVSRISPVEASRRYIEHLVAVWTRAFPDAPIAQQDIVLTVPASFDASARELTREAAIRAGLPDHFTLLEEPQAALYAWLQQQGDGWRRQLKPDDVLLVCDVGGGTTDFTLIRVADENGQLELRRIAVGTHTLVGGDNMDLTLAHHAANALAEKGTQLDPWQSVSLWHACRAAKEALLAPGGVGMHPITVAGRGSRLIGGSVTVELQQQAVQSLLVDGFFPQCALAERPAKKRASGFREVGLPYETDAGITRHLAAFLSSQAAAGASVVPTHVLFNGGVFKAQLFQNRLIDALTGWYDRTPAVLGGADDLDYAVARGAAYYALVKQGRGVRIRGGTARSYYVGIETAGLAIPGGPRPMNALCVVPFGMEEGTTIDVPSEAIGLVVGEPAAFRFFSSTTRHDDKPGDLLRDVTQLDETDSMEANLPPASADEDDYVPVKFQSRLNELGLFELWCIGDAGQWKLEFSVREES